MDLFNEYYSSEMQFLLDLFSLNRPFTLDEAVERARAAHVYAPYDSHVPIVEKWTALGLLEQLPDGTYRIGPGLRSFALPPNVLEADYLSDICGTAEARLFVPEGVASFFRREGLSALDFIARQNTVGKAKEAAAVPVEVFRALLEAIYQGRRIHYDYRTNAAPTPRSAVGVPYRLEYSVFDGRWWLISYNEAEDRSIKSRLENILAVRPGQVHRVAEETIRAAITRNLAAEPVVLHIRNRKNVLERCFLLFESMPDMTAFQLGEDEYRLCFRYFRWDNHVIVRRLLYLGENVTARSPSSIVEELKGELRAALLRQGGVLPSGV